jgi:hypothetical protein
MIAYPAWPLISSATQGLLGARPAADVAGRDRSGSMRQRRDPRTSGQRPI